MILPDTPNHDGLVDMLYHDGCPFMLVACDVRHRLPDAEQQQHDKDSEHADNHVQSLLWRKRIKS